MSGTLNAKTELVDQLIRGFEIAGASQSDVRCFLNSLSSGLDEETLQSYSDETLLSLTLDSFKYIRKRPPNSHKIRAYDVKPEGDDNEQKNYTVIEVLNDDMPFLVDSIMGELQEQELEVKKFLHPILHAVRNVHGELEKLVDEEFETPSGYMRESYIHVQLELISDQRKKDLVAGISNILELVRLAVADWRAMSLRVSSACTAYTDAPPPVDVVTLTESVQFLKWLADNHFTFLGMREYELIGEGETQLLKPVDGSSLGILRDLEQQVLRTGAGKKYEMSDESRQFFFSPEPLIITKANMRSVIHRRVHMDYVGVKLYDINGNITGELRIVGLFTSTAYSSRPKSIPFIRNKVDSVLRQYGQRRSGHAGKALQNVLETFPRDELFQISADRLYETAVKIMSLDVRPRSEVIIRMDEFNRFASILVYVPRDRFSTETRQNIGAYLARELDGRVSAFLPFFLEGPLVRIHFIIGLNGEYVRDYSESNIRHNVALILRSWRDELKEELSHEFLPSKAANLLHKYGRAFTAGYEELTPIDRAVQDVVRMESLTKERPIAVKFYSEDSFADGHVRVSIYHLGEPIPLSKRVPILEHFGFSVIDERTFQVSPNVEEPAFSTISLNDMDLSVEVADGVDLEKAFKRLEDGFIAIWNDLAEDDIYNQLLLPLSVSWREISIVRAMGAFLRQLGIPFGQGYIGETLLKHSNITKALIELFRLRNNPNLAMEKAERENLQAELTKEIEKELVLIPSLDEDRILRLFLDLNRAVLRTNFYCFSEKGDLPETLNFKFDSQQVDAIPHPKPFVETFVYSPRVEGVHLRGGKVARGGLRWSDRRQDFRTEVLGLVKAQQVKNSVIVPTGSKGGFFPKRLEENASREERMEVGIESYKLFVSSLLSLADNLVDGKITQPDQVVCYDDDDPYLVVAADKGTASFSDYANEISQAREFWLDDAFASGGSAGYDHKKMGITARGAWESVKRHFREMDRDIQNESFTVIGIGDMSGDVFGNGMILSKATKLLAAFDHRDIFIDPEPKQERAWLERKRLFEMDRSSWQNYNQELISEGGGVFSRQSKFIELSPEIKAMTGLLDDSVTPNRLIHALLKAPTDLMWFGGIGTYICASGERDEEVGDRANDAIRVRAQEVQAKVIGEGANLGMTQAARIEFAKAGGRVNSDAIDNSAGVNSSDLEVNIKITFGAMIRAGKISLEERDKLLGQMTDAVAQSCLRNNYLQSLIISLGQRKGARNLGFQKRLINQLENSGLLNRSLEYLPSDSEISSRARNGLGLTRPEYAVLLAYAKIDLFNKLIDSDVPDDDFLDAELFEYFPEMLRNLASDEIKAHRLRREIIATQLSNAIINRGGATIMLRIGEETGDGIEEISYAFVAARAIFDLESVYSEIDELDTKVTGDLQLSMYEKIQDLLRDQTRWFLHNEDLSSGLSDIIDVYKKGLSELDLSIEKIMGASRIEELKQDQANYEEQGIPADLATYMASLKFLSSGPDIILVAKNSGRDIQQAARAYGLVGEEFNLFELKRQAAELGYGDYFDRVAVNGALKDISMIQRLISEEVLKEYPGEDIELSKWITSREIVVERAQQLISDILRSDELTVAKLTVGVSHLRQLC